MKAAPICAERCRLGEGPLWVAREQAIYWVDVLGRRVLRCRGHDLAIFPAPMRASALAELGDGRLLVTGDSGVWFLDPQTGAFAHWLDLEADRPHNRMNDAKVGPDGRLWAGSMHAAAEGFHGRLHRLDATGRREVLLDDVGIANTLAWSGDGRRFYFADSAKSQMHVYPLTDDRLGAGVLYCETAPPETPDGSAMDSEDHLWTAHWDGACVARRNPRGEIVERIDLPVSCPTSCAFGGPDLKTLYITSAAIERAQEPLAGATFAVRVETPGRAIPSFGAR